MTPKRTPAALSLPPAPDTEGIKYAGSKLKLLPQILYLARKTPAKTVFDGFSGTTRTAQAFAKSGYRVWANDCAVWSEVFGTCYLLNRKSPDDYRGLIEHLNAAAPQDGWFTEHYGGAPRRGQSIQADGLKRPWQIKNTRKLDGIRNEIDRLQLPAVDRAVALTSLILALDQVDNTLGHQAAYLQAWSQRSFKDLRLRVPAVFTTPETHTVSRGDIFDTLPRVKADLAYFDPPYGANNAKMPPSRVRYAAYYHLWTTVCLNDRPALFGKAKRRADTSDPVAGSVFEEFRQTANGQYVAVEALRHLLQAAPTPWVILSYSSGGRANAASLHEVLTASGKILEIQRIDYPRHVMSGMTWTREWVRAAEKPHREFLFLIEKK